MHFKFMNESRTQKDILNSHNCASQASKCSPSQAALKNITLPYMLCSWQFTLTWEDWPSCSSPLFPPSLQLARGACVWLSARVSMCGADGFRRAGCHTRKRGPVTHSERPYVCLRELNASGRGSRQKTLGEQWGVITQAPWLINRESGAPGPLESPMPMGGGSPLQMWGCNCIKAWQEEK